MAPTRLMQPQEMLEQVTNKKAERLIARLSSFIWLTNDWSFIRRLDRFRHYIDRSPTLLRFPESALHAVQLVQLPPLRPVPQTLSLIHI